jgi:hypothetical protein
MIFLCRYFLWIFLKVKRQLTPLRNSWRRTATGFSVLMQNGRQKNSFSSKKAADCNVTEDYKYELQFNLTLPKMQIQMKFI